MPEHLKQKKHKSDDTAKQSLKNYARYSGIAFQMAVIIFAGTFGGYKADKYFNFESPILTIIFSVLSVVLAIYTAIKDFIKK